MKPTILLISTLLLIAACGGQDDSGSDVPETKELTIEDTAWNLIHAGALLVDVRSDAEFQQGHLEGALHIPHDQIRERVAELGDNKNRSVVLYCAAGGRAGMAQSALAELGFVNVINAGGYEPLLAAKP